MYDTTRHNAVSEQFASAIMRVPLLCALFVVSVMSVAAAPGRSVLQTGGTDVDSQPFVEEVVVESVLQIRSPSSRQARTNTRTNLQDGIRIYEEKKN